LNVDRRIRIRTHTFDYWIRILIRIRICNTDFKIRRTVFFKGVFLYKIFLFIRANELVAEAAAVQAGVPAVADPARRMHGQLVRDQLKDNMPARGGGGRRR